MEEHVLCLLLSAEELDIVDDQDIDPLVEVDKIVLVVVSYRFDVLPDKLLGGYIENGAVGQIVLYLDANCVTEMGFPKANVRINIERIESSFTGIFCNSEAGRPGKAVTIAFNKVVK